MKTLKISNYKNKCRTLFNIEFQLTVNYKSGFYLMPKQYKMIKQNSFCYKYKLKYFSTSYGFVRTN